VPFDSWCIRYSALPDVKGFLHTMENEGLPRSDDRLVVFPLWVTLGLDTPHWCCTRRRNRDGNVWLLPVPRGVQLRA